MNFYPAIDLLGGKAVRLFKGLKDQATVYFDRPLDAAQLWKKAGTEWLHIVDLDAAFSGSREQAGIIREIVNETALAVQVGGGVRDTESVRFYLEEVGVRRVVIGTAAFKDWDWFCSMTRAYPGRITLGLDIKDERVAIRGWTETSWTEEEALEKASQVELAAVLMTDVSRDGAMTGPNVRMLTRAAKKMPGKVIASGGISRIEDLTALQGLSLEGVISGKAIYEGKLDVAAAIKVLQ